MRLSVQRPGALALIAALAFVLRGGVAHAQDTGAPVRIGLTYAPGTKPGVLVLPVNGDNGDSVRAILQRDLDFGDRVNVIATESIAMDSPAITFARSPYSRSRWMIARTESPLAPFTGRTNTPGFVPGA